MSPLSNANNNNNSNPSSNLNHSSLSLSSTNNNQCSTNSAFKPLISENRQLNMLSVSGPPSSADQYSSEAMAYGSGYTHPSQLAPTTQDYLNSHQQHQLPLSVYKSEHDDVTGGYSFARPVKLYEHASAMEPPPPTGYPTATSQHTGFRGDAPSPGASIIDLSTSSVTALRTQGFGQGAYYDGQRYDRSPQSASSPHYSSPQMLSPQGQTLDLSVGRTRLVQVLLVYRFYYKGGSLFCCILRPHWQINDSSRQHCTVLLPPHSHDIIERNAMELTMCCYFVFYIHQ